MRITMGKYASGAADRRLEPVCVHTITTVENATFVADSLLRVRAVSIALLAALWKPPLAR